MLFYFCKSSFVYCMPKCASEGGKGPFPRLPLAAPVPCIAKLLKKILLKFI